MTRLDIVAGVCILFSTSLWAETVTEDKNSNMGEQTRHWLDFQSSGAAASSHPQTISGPVAAKIYQRYQDSFTYPVPEYFSGDDADASVLGQ